MELFSILDSKFEMTKFLRTYPGAQNFSPKLRAQIQKSHEQTGECFLCRGMFLEHNHVPRQTGGSNWSQVMPFMKKFDIPPCLLGLGDLMVPPLVQSFTTPSAHKWPILAWPCRCRWENTNFATSKWRFCRFSSVLKSAWK